MAVPSDGGTRARDGCGPRQKLQSRSAWLTLSDDVTACPDNDMMGVNADGGFTRKDGEACSAGEGR
ncbi:hypothetical protein BOSEA31B_14369 [Hyphomicrobiales bacterium]|nr:hypothetical protein BOSEA31B_14369 [Hyphomicrobiales bacterium]CAH1700148.1 hypothetical protein BOSEA1005_13201 [Hyphomicrobiales bacterium]CAI0343910.1 hypothetical protein BO1005MUT1_300106 [Hyphomicrobiales bacterium]